MSKVDPSSTNDSDNRIRKVSWPRHFSKVWLSEIGKKFNPISHIMSESDLFNPIADFPISGSVRFRSSRISYWDAFNNVAAAWWNKHLVILWRAYPRIGRIHRAQITIIKSLCWSNNVSSLGDSLIGPLKWHEKPLFMLRQLWAPESKKVTEVELRTGWCYADAAFFLFRGEQLNKYSCKSHWGGGRHPFYSINKNNCLLCFILRD